MEYGILISGMHYFLIVDYHLAAVSRRFETICVTFTALLTRTESRRGGGWEGIRQECRRQGSKRAGERRVSFV